MLLPGNVAALEDKIVQQATRTVLECIYEPDFLGFSYGFRPGRSQHRALDALYVGITKRKVNWIIDADIPDAFWLPLDLPRHARVEYKFEVVRRGHGRWMQDPRNRRRAFDPFGSNSVCPASSYTEPEWVNHDAASRQGTLVDERITSTAFEGVRTVRSALMLARQVSVSMPIAEAVAAVLFEGQTVSHALTALLAREPRPEDDPGDPFRPVLAGPGESGTARERHA